MIGLIVVIGLYVAVELYKHFSIKNDIVVNMTMNTEANEQVSFSFKLHNESDKDTMISKINNIFEVSEQRRQFQYERIEKLRIKAIEDAESLKTREQNVSVLHSKKD